MGSPLRQDGSRVSAFIDAAFAFVLSLLVSYGTEVPQTSAELFDAMRAVPAFAASFAIIVMFWYAHVQWSRLDGRYQGWSLLYSILLTFVVLVFVYPLRVLFSSLFAWLSGGRLAPLTTGQDWGRDLSLMYLFFGLAFGLMAACMVGLYHQTRRRPTADREQISQVDRTEATVNLATFAACTITALLSLITTALVAASGSDVAWPLPGGVYFLLVLTPLLERWVRRRDPEATPAS